MHPSADRNSSNALSPAWRISPTLNRGSLTIAPDHRAHEIGTARKQDQYSMSDRQIRISAGDTVVTAVLNDSATADQLWGALPITGRAQTWGDEIYFSIPVKAAEEANSQDTVDVGTVAYWPPGSALCLFWGPTPMSAAGEIRPASAVNVIGLIDGDPTVLGQVDDGTEIAVERTGG